MTNGRLLIGLMVVWTSLAVFVVVSLASVGCDLVCPTGQQQKTVWTLVLPSDCALAISTGERTVTYATSCDRLTAPPWHSMAVCRPQTAEK